MAVTHGGQALAASRNEGRGNEVIWLANRRSGDPPGEVYPPVKAAWQGLGISIADGAAAGGRRGLDPTLILLLTMTGLAMTGLAMTGLAVAGAALSAELRPLDRLARAAERRRVSARLKPRDDVGYSIPSPGGIGGTAAALAERESGGSEGPRRSAADAGADRIATAQEQAEVALRECQDQLRLAQQVGGVAYSDRRLSEPTASISTAFARLFGLPPEQTQISVEAWESLLHPEDRDQVLAGRDAAQAHGTPFNAEFRICRPDGAVRWLNMHIENVQSDDGQSRRLISASVDITDIVAAKEALTARKEELERRVAERTAALAEEEARFHGIFDAQFQHITLLAANGTVLEVNRTALAARGLRRDDVIGKPAWEIDWWPGLEPARFRASVAKAAQGVPIYCDIDVSGADGKRQVIDFSLKPVLDPVTGAVLSIIAEGKDLTKKRELASQLAQAQKVQALGQLAAGIAHDFNNILQAVSGAAALIELRPDDHDRRKRLTRTIVSAATRGASITQRLLSFARRGELCGQTIDTAELVDNLREVLGHTLGGTITVSVSVAPGVPALLADLAQLETAVINLGTNARDAMPDGGMLVMRAEAELVAEAGHPAGLAPGAYVRLSVSDTGMGMSQETLARVSEPFFTTKPLGKGTGLGLAMVRGFAEQSGGGLLIASELGGGTTVTLWLPQSTETMPMIATARRPHHDETILQARRTIAPRILLVSDDDLFRETLADQLEAEGFALLVAASGVEAVALLKAGEPVDAMLSDLSMPGFDGVRTLEQARAVRPSLPCFLLTGYEVERGAFSDQNVFTLVRKPVSGRALAMQIEASLDGARR